MGRRELALLGGLALLCGCRPAAAEGEATAWVTRAVQAPGLQHRTFESAAADTAVSYHILLPSAYDASPDRHFPVLYWLHGSGGGLPGLAWLARWFRDAIAAGRVPPLLVVFPNGLPEGMWCDSKDGRTPVETVVVGELVPQIDATYRTIPSRAGRLVEGFSMGGYGALRLGFRYPELFGAVSSLSGGPLQLDFLADAKRAGPRQRQLVFQSVYGGDQDYFAACSPWVLAERNATAIRGRLPVRVVIGGRDVMLDTTRRFHQRLVDLAIDHTYQELPDLDHQPNEVLTALGDEVGAFYLEALTAVAPAGGDG